MVTFAGSPARRQLRNSAKAPPTLDLSFVRGGNVLDSRITFVRASVATYFDAAGVMQTASTNTPRFDYHPVTHVPRGLLIEEARTNLLLNSATLATQNVTVTAAATTLSFTGTGTVTLTGASTAGPLVGTGAATRVDLTFTPTAGSLTCTVSGTVTNAQVETGASASSYIPTTVAAATRAAELPSMVLGSWFSNTSGTYAVTFATPPALSPPTSQVIRVSDGTSANQDALFIPSGGTSAFRGNTLAAAANQGAINVGIYAPGARVKAAYSFGPVARQVAVNGVLSAPAAGLSRPIGMTTMEFGCAQGGQQLNSTIEAVRYWPRTMPAGELQQVTR